MQQDVPSEANLLMALAEMHKQGRFQVAGDVTPLPLERNLEALKRIPPGIRAEGYENADPNAVAKGVMSGKVKVLNPSGN